ncbi:MAG: hypothetical protein NVS3B28_26800 [Candidatus Velthaea sp.]
MTSLFVVHDAPYPARSGSPLRAWQNINLLATLGPVHVFSAGLREADASMPVAASWTHVDANDYPDRSAGLLPRLRRALRPREFPIENDFITDLVNGKLAALVREVRPDVIVVSHWHTALPRSLRGRHILVADTHNVESDLARQLWTDARGKLSLRRRYQVWQWRRRERALLRRVDRIWATSEGDARTFRTMDRKFPPITVWPNAIDVASYAGLDARQGPARSQRTGSWPTIAYVGFYGYEPNAQAAAALIERVFPHIAAAFPAARLLLIGKSPTDAMQRAAENDANVVTPRGSYRDSIDDRRRHARKDLGSLCGTHSGRQHAERRRRPRRRLRQAHRGH